MIRTNNKKLSLNLLDSLDAQTATNTQTVGGAYGVDSHGTRRSVEGRRRRRGEGFVPSGANGPPVRRHRGSTLQVRIMYNRCSDQPRQVLVWAFVVAVWCSTHVVCGFLLISDFGFCLIFNSCLFVFLVTRFVRSTLCFYVPVSCWCFRPHYTRVHTHIRMSDCPALHTHKHMYRIVPHLYTRHFKTFARLLCMKIAVINQIIPGTYRKNSNLWTYGQGR